MAVVEFKPFHSLSAIIFVIDTSDHERLPAAKYELLKLFEDDHLMQAHFLILGNKRVSYNHYFLI